MKLSEINKILSGQINEDITFNKIRTSSKEIEKGDLFLAINKGHDYINEAIKNGAVAIICEKYLDIPSIKVDDSEPFVYEFVSTNQDDLFDYFGLN